MDKENSNRFGLICYQTMNPKLLFHLELIGFFIFSILTHLNLNIKFFFFFEFLVNSDSIFMINEFDL